MAKKNELGKLKTTELLDKIHQEEVKDDLNKGDSDLIEGIESELDKRLPFRVIESRLAGEEGVENQVNELRNKLDEIKKQLLKHDHMEGRVVVKL